MSGAYEEFAYCYDELMDTVPYEEWCGRIVDAIDRYGITKRVRPAGETAETSDEYPERPAEEPTDLINEEDESNSEKLLESERNLVVDLGCGTGTITEMLYAEGFDMIGIDNSEEMLEEAILKRDESGSEILYLNQDMLELELFSTVGTVISVCDSINYLTGDEELETVAALVHNYLYPGGLFIFDFNTEYKYREVIGDRTIAENRDDISFIWENYYDSERKINEYDLTLFVMGEDGRYDRFDEVHFQKGYEASYVEEVLKSAGFEIIEMKDSESGEKAKDTTERVFVIARCIK